MMEKFLIQMIFKITLVLFIVLSVLKLLGATLEESIYFLIWDKKEKIEKIISSNNKD